MGLKPTYGLASIRGIVPLSVSLDHVGPMSRSVADAALLLQAIAGYDPRDVASVEVLVPDDYGAALRRRTSALRLGVPRVPFFDDVDAQVLAATEDALETLATLTAGNRDVELPPLPAARPVGVEAYAYHARYLADRGALYAPSTLERIESGREMTASEYAGVLYELELGRKAIREVFDEVDLLVTPTLMELPITIAAALEAPIEATRRLIRNPAPFNVYGIPAISVPCGFSRDGLPIGLQISGAPFAESDVLALAHAYQQVTGWHRRTPPEA